MLERPANPAAEYVQSALRSLMDSVIGQSERWVSVLFATSLFVSASLLFLVQPMFAKVLLPLLGGAPAVWNTCVVFYELILLAGYVYAYVLQRTAKRPIQVAVHLTLVVLVLAFLPLRIHAPFATPTPETAVLWVLGTLFFSLGLPLLVLSATSPLLQSWFGATSHRRAHDPYFLYAASNAGSMLGLLCYPFLLEPLIGLHSQTSVWTVGYFALAACLAGASAVFYRSGRTEPEDASETAATEPLVLARKIRWVILALVPSSFMLSVTTYLSTAIAPIPLLWVVPLALYLLTLVIAFSANGDARLARLRRISPYTVVPLIVLLAVPLNGGALLQIAVHLTAFFFIALTCHSTLATNRPPKEHLTEFYLWVATGGALGGIFTAILAPIAFKTVIEYPLMLILAAYFLRDPSEQTKFSRVRDVYMPLLLGAALAVFISLESQLAPDAALALKVRIAFIIAALVAVAAFRRPVAYAVSVAALVLCSMLYTSTTEHRLYVERNFFGVLTVLNFGPYHLLYHGPTIHGIENMQAAYRTAPLSYYSQSGPLGQLFTSLQPRLKQGSIAVVGLGVGSSLCYHAQGQRWTIYEIDPGVDRIARDPQLFALIAGCAPDAPTVLGDARLSLEQAPDSTYDLMILDAYSADYVPIHLLTREALALYVQKMSDHGVLAFHITNAWFDLQTVLTALSQNLDLTCYVQHDRVLKSGQENAGKFRSDWLVLAHQPSDLGAVTLDHRWQRCSPTTFRVWTDDYSSLVTAIPIYFSIGEP